MKKQTIGMFIDSLVYVCAIHESSIVEVRDKNNNIKWRGLADNYPVYLDSVWFVEMVVYDYDADVLVVKADF